MFGDKAMKNLISFANKNLYIHWIINKLLTAYYPLSINTKYVFNRTLINYDLCMNDLRSEYLRNQLIIIIDAVELLLKVYNHNLYLLILQLTTKKQPEFLFKSFDNQETKFAFNPFSFKSYSLINLISY